MADGEIAKRLSVPPVVAKSRIERLRQGIRVEKFPLCVEKIRLMTESFRQTDGEPQILRRAKALAHVLDNIRIFIEDDEMIVGNAASKPMGVELEYDYGIWRQDEIEALKQEGFSIEPEAEAELDAFNEYWKSKTLVWRMGELFDDETLWPFMQSGIVLPPWKTKHEGSGGGYAQSGLGLGPGFVLCGLDYGYAKVLNEGLSSIIREAKDAIRTIDFAKSDALVRRAFLESVIIAHEAIIRFAHRFADLAARLAVQEGDRVRRLELEHISQICRRVPELPARTFSEAIQAFWFIFLVVTPSPVAAAGRFDQYMYPFYKDDVENGRVTEETALELLQCLRIKDMQINRTSGKINRQKNAGMAKWHNWTIGGVTPLGDDASNPLTYMILEAARRCPTPHHTITLRVHDATPEPLMLKALEVVKAGIGMPAFIGDRSYVDFLIGEGVPIEQARDYVVSGCLDVNIPGRSRTNSVGMFIVALVFDIFIHNGVEPKTGRQLGPTTGDFAAFESFDQLLAAFKQQLLHFMSLAAQRNNIEMGVERELFPDPVRSSLMYDAIAVGHDMLDRTMPFENAAVFNPIGMINVADSLAAIRKLVFDDRTYSLGELKEALDANWRFDEPMRRAFLAAPKYGNGDDYADAIASDLYQFWADSAATFATIYDGRHKPTAISITSHAPGGAMTGATPDGRFAGEVLADGCMSPMRGRDSHGPTGAIKSAIKIDQRRYQAALMNMKFHPSALQSTADLRKLSALIRTYFSFGGKHVQFNVVTKDTLLAAQKDPEGHRDLVVRMAGYSVYFVQLGKAVQDEIIERMEHQGVT